MDTVKVPNTKEELIKLLKSFGIPVEKFGTGDAKTIDDLLCEIREGDSKLIVSENKLHRVVSMIRAEIFYKDLILLEYLQVFNDGRERERNRLCLSEKLHGDEDKISALKRAFAEELGIESELDYKDKGAVKETDNPNTGTYPDLNSEYTFYNFTVILTDEQFNKDGYIEINENTGTKTFFKWIKNTKN